MVNILGESRLAGLGFIRVQERATARNLKDLITLRLETVGLSVRDVVVAATDGGRNVRKAVRLMGLRNQQCFAHGLDLVVRKVTYGKKAMAFDVVMISAFIDSEKDIQADGDADESWEGDADDENEEISGISDGGDSIDEDGGDSIWEDEGDSIDEDERYAIDTDEGDSNDEAERDTNDANEGYTNVATASSPLLLGEVVERLRKVCREFKKKPVMMDELRRVTSKEEFNKKSLKVVLDCPTRWYSTLLMIERALRILPAMNNVLSRHSVPISAQDAEALEKIAAVLSPFKNAILLLCKKEATLRNADRIFLLMLQDLRKTNTALADMLLERLKTELSKRRTILSSLLAVLENPNYDFKLEREIGIREPSDQDMLELLSEIIDTDTTPPEIDSTEDADSTVRFLALLALVTVRLKPS